MSSRSHHYDYSLWPEHARPRRKRFSLKGIAATLTVLAVCAFAASVVYSEFSPMPDSKALVGRTWPLQSAVDQAQVPAPAVRSVAAPVVEPDGAKQPRPAPRMPVNAANRKVMPSIGTARAPASETDGRGTASSRPSTEASLAKTAAPAAAATIPDTTASTQTPAEPKPVAAEKPAKPHKKVVRRRQERSTNAAVATQVYDYPDGRRVTVYRRVPGPEGYNGYAPGGYGGYGGYGTWRPNYAEQPGGYRRY